MIEKDSNSSGEMEKVSLTAEERSFWDNFRPSIFLPLLAVTIVATLIASASFHWLLSLNVIYLLLIGGVLSVFLIVGYLGYSWHKLSTEKASLKDIIGSKDNELRAARSNMEILNKQIVDLEGEMKEATELLSDKDKDVRILSEEKQNLQSEFEKLSAAFQEEKTKLEVVQKKLSEKDAKLKETESELVDCRGKLSSVQDRFAQLEKRTESLENDIIAKENTINSLDGKVKHAEKELSSARYRIDSHMRQVTPALKASSGVSHDRRLLRKRLEKDIHRVHLRNTGSVPAYNISGTVTLYRVSGEPISTNVDIAVLHENEKLPIAHFTLPPNTRCSRIGVSLDVLDILEYSHDFDVDLVCR